MTDNLFQIALEGIERHTHWLRHSAKEALHYAQLLNAQRNFETRAEAAITDAEAALTEALDQLQKARATYQALPKE